MINVHTPSDHAPIALFTYNRPRHLRKTIEALLKNPESSSSPLIIFSDGPKRSDDSEAVFSVRNYLKTVVGFAETRIIERSSNLGLSANIIDGVTKICREYGRIIVLEDDMITSPLFLRYMNDALSIYKATDQVISIHAYIYPINKTLPETFFLRGADCWGWATWQRGWELFESDGIQLLKKLNQRSLGHAFDMDGSYPYTSMLKRQIAGENDSWAIRWYASAFLNDKLTLYPGRSLVQNIGLDGSGTHCTKNDFPVVDINAAPINLVRQIPEEDLHARFEVARFLASQSPSIGKRIFRKIKKHFHLA